MAVPNAVDYFVDLSSTDYDKGALWRHLGMLRSRSGLGLERDRYAIVGRGAALSNSGVEPYGPHRGATDVFRAALWSAATSERALLVILGDWIPSAEVVTALAEFQGEDPMVGVVQPRFAHPEDDSIIRFAPVHSQEQQQGRKLPKLPVALAGGLRRVTSRRNVLRRQAVPFLPRFTLIPELPAAVFLITPQGVSATDCPPEGTIRDALAVCLTGLRRRGFRTLIAHHVVSSFTLGAELAYPSLPLPSTDGEHLWRDDSERAAGWLANAPEQTYEAVLSGAFTREGRGRVLLDCRAMQPLHNGTAHSILGILEGFGRLQETRFEITALVDEAAARFHRLEGRSHGVRVQVNRPSGTYLAAVHLSQPWCMQTIVELHRLAAMIAFNVLDTIAWDIIYAAPDGLDRTWRLASQFADGLLFISDFTRERFVFRFPPGPGVATEVMYLSMAAEDLVSKTLAPPSDGMPYLLIIGNSYDHKGVRPALDTLVDAFPHLPIRAIGLDASSSSRIEILQSGYIEKEKIDALIANAGVVVFPSFYEGFGMPVVQALAWGRPVVVRRSPLWEEIAGHSRLPGTLIPFRNEVELVASVGKALHRLPIPGLTSGDLLASDAKPPNWRDCAESIIRLVDRMALGCNGTRWVNRDAVIGHGG